MTVLSFEIGRGYRIIANPHGWPIMPHLATVRQTLPVTIEVAKQRFRH